MDGGCGLLVFSDQSGGASRAVNKTERQLNKKSVFDFQKIFHVVPRECSENSELSQGRIAMCQNQEYTIKESRKLGQW